MECTMSYIAVIIEFFSKILVSKVKLDSLQVMIIVFKKGQRNSKNDFEEVQLYYK